MTEGVLRVVTLAWLLVTHSWLNPSAAASPRGRYAAAAGSALLSGYAYMIHSRGLVMLAGYAAVGAFIAWRRPAAQLRVAAAGLVPGGARGAGLAMKPHPCPAPLPRGPPGPVRP